MKAKNLTQWLRTFKGTKVNIFLHSNDLVKGTLLDVKEDHVVIESKNNVFYIVINQIRAISKSAKYSDIEHKMVHYINRAYITGVLFSLKHNWITINGLGGLPFNGVLSGITDDHIILINGEELLYIHKSWISNLNRGIYLKTDLPHNANTGQVIRSTPVDANHSPEDKSVLLGEKVQSCDKNEENKIQYVNLKGNQDEVANEIEHKYQIQAQDEVPNEIKHKYQVQTQEGIQSEIQHKHQNQTQDMLHRTVQNEVSDELQSEAQHEVLKDDRSKAQDELSNDVSDDIQSEAQHEVLKEDRSKAQDELSNEVSDDIQSEAQHEVLKEDRSKAQDELSNDVLDELQSKAPIKVLKEDQSKVQDEVSNDVSDDIQSEAQNDVSNKIQNETKDEILNDIQNKNQKDPNDYYTFHLSQKVNKSTEKNEFAFENGNEIKEESGFSECRNHSMDGAGETKESLVMNKTQLDIEEKPIQDLHVDVNESYEEQSGFIQEVVQFNQPAGQVNEEQVQGENHYTPKNNEQEIFMENKKIAHVHEQVNKEEISPRLEYSNDNKITLEAEKNQYGKEQKKDSDSSQGLDKSLSGQSDYHFEEIVYIYPDIEVTENKAKRYISFEMDEREKGDNDLKQDYLLNSSKKSRPSNGLNGGDTKNHLKEKSDQGRSSTPANSMLNDNKQVSSKEDKKLLLKQYHALMKHAEKMYKKLSEGE
ncbi:Protein of uncharacterised function (DUF2642) [Bacillus freudenreichii]|nr:Protein of uncharacterised function (DUF2642) [Bacillus freudenreichii]